MSSRSNKYNSFTKKKLPTWFVHASYDKIVHRKYFHGTLAVNKLPSMTQEKLQFSAYNIQSGMGTGSGVGVGWEREQGGGLTIQIWYITQVVDLCCYI